MDRRYKRDLPPDGWIDPSDYGPADPMVGSEKAMAVKMLGRDFVKIVCDMLGINDGHVFSVRVTADCASAVTVEIRMRPTPEQGEMLAKAAMEGASIAVVPSGTRSKDGRVVASWPTAADGTPLIMTPELVRQIESGEFRVDDAARKAMLDEDNPNGLLPVPEIVEKPK